MLYVDGAFCTLRLRNDSLKQIVDIHILRMQTETLL